MFNSLRDKIGTAHNLSKEEPAKKYLEKGANKRTKKLTN